VANTNFTGIDRIFYSDGYRLGQAAIGKGMSADRIASGLAELYASVDGLIDSLLQQAERSVVKVDCAKGCAWCCYQPVFVNTLEIQNLLEFIKVRFSSEKTAQIAERAALKNCRVTVMKREEMLNYKSACPLLEDGSCIAYAARPMACSIYLSTSVASCRMFYDNPENGISYPELLEFPLRAGRMLNEGFVAAFHQHGYTSSEVRMDEGLVSLLNC
jgi:Fe-S-cluster containining protein